MGKTKVTTEVTEIKRVNLLLVSFMRNILHNELKNFESLEKVDLFNLEKTLIGKLFNRVFKSQK